MKRPVTVGTAPLTQPPKIAKQDWEMFVLIVLKQNIQLRSVTRNSTAITLKNGTILASVHKNSQTTAIIVRVRKKK